MRVCLRVLLLTLLLSVAVKGSFSDFLTQSPVYADQLEKDISHLQAQLTHSHLRSIRSASAQTEGLMDNSNQFSANHLKAKNYECTGGKNPSSMSAKDYLQAFAKGPCTPVAVLAGITGTKLQVQIDCKILKASHPKLFKDCGWQNCSGLTTNVIGTSPKKEYTIWIPGATSPFSLVDPTNDAKRCLVGLFKLEWTRQNNQLQFSSAKGVKIVPLGMTEDTAKHSKCGFESISNILPIAKVLSPKKYKIFNGLREELEDRGYVLGLTATAIPYDWRVPISHNGMAKRMLEVLETLNSITGKRVSIVAHSMGNINTLNLLSKISQEKKDLLVQRYFALAPPYAGAPEAFAVMLGGNDDLQFGMFGIKFWGFKQLVSTFSAIYDLMPRTFWSRYDSAPWMKSLRNRINQEAGLKPTPLSVDDDTVSKYFPKHDAICKNKNWDKSPKTCASGLSEMKTFGRVQDDLITVDNMKFILEKYSFDSMAPVHLVGDGKREEFDKMPNPGVETVIIYGNTLNTASNYIWKYNPKPRAIKNDADYQEASEVNKKLGDGTVLTSSAIGPGIKWAWEFDHKFAGSKPVIFAELCSKHQQVRDVYQDQKSKKVSHNAYQGVACQCDDGQDKDCDHVGLVSDSHTINYIVESLMDNQPANSKRKFDGVSESHIKEFRDSCAVISKLA